MRIMSLQAGRKLCKSEGGALNFDLAKRFKWEHYSIKISKWDLLGGFANGLGLRSPAMYHLRNSFVHLQKTPTGRTRDAGSLEQG